MVCGESKESDKQSIQFSVSMFMYIDTASYVKRLALAGKFKAFIFLSKVAEFLKHVSCLLMIG